MYKNVIDTRMLMEVILQHNIVLQTTKRALGKNDRLKVSFYRILTHMNKKA